MQPARQRLPACEASRLPGERDEDVLRDLLGHARVAHLAQRRRVNQIDVPGHERVEGGLRPFGGEGGYEFRIG